MRALKWFFDTRFLPYVYGVVGTERYLDLMFKRWGTRFNEYYIENLYPYESQDYIDQQNNDNNE